MRRVLKQILLFILVTAILFTNIQISQAAGTGTVRVNDFYQMKSQEESTIIKEEKSQEEGNQEKDSSDYKDKEDKKEDKKEEGRYLRREFSYTRFQQAMILPDDVVKEKIQARMEHGVLTIDIPKQTVIPEEKNGRTIEIK